MTEQPAGPLVDSLGVRVDLDANQQLTEVLLIGKVTDFDSAGTIMVIAKSEGLDWIGQLGLLHGALQVADADPPINAD